MPSVRLVAENSIVFLVDLQSKLVPHIEDGHRVVRRAAFLLNVARELGIPIVATEQNPLRMGATDASLGEMDPAAHAKMRFSGVGCEAALAQIRASGRRQVVIVGVETHICVSLTAHDLLAEGFQVVVCPDAVGARTMDRHKLGMERIRDAGAAPAHTEAVAYEWMVGADHPKFKAVLELVKAG